MMHDTDCAEDWFACAIPLQSTWEPVDLSPFNTLRFTLYTDEECGGLVRLEDANGTESADFEIETMAPHPGQENTINLSLDAFVTDDLNTKEIKLLKFIGYKGAAFYISEVCLE
jgi:hypothetical protein